jgi:glycosyltransferase involved in cell wall biosynthesis
VRVLHLAAGNLYGGVERLLSVLARRRDCAVGMEPEFALCFEGLIQTELASFGVPVHMLGAVRTRRPLSVLRARRELRVLLRARAFDVAVCHSAWPHAMFGPVLRAAQVPIVFFMHDRAGRHWVDRCARRNPPDLVICNSSFTKTGLVEMFPTVPACVIYCPVELSLPANSADILPDRFAIRNELDTAQESKVIVQVSRMEAWKGQRFHLDALQKLSGVDNWVCWIVGGPQRPAEYDYYDMLRRRASEHGIADKLRFVGHRSDISRLLRAADIFCQPNTSPEPFGLVFVEALLSGLPVISANMGGAKEIVDESCGLLVAPGDVNGLAEALRTLIVDGSFRQRLASRASRRGLELCDPNVQIPCLAATLDDVARSKGVGRTLAAQLSA